MDYIFWARNWIAIHLYNICVWPVHCSDGIKSAMVSQITGVSIVCSKGCSSAVQRKYQSFTPLPLGRGIHWWPVGSPREGLVTRKMFSFDDVFMYWTHFRDDGGLFGMVYNRSILVWFLLAWYCTNMWNTFLWKTYRRRVISSYMHTSKVVIGKHKTQIPRCLPHHWALQYATFPL